MRCAVLCGCLQPNPEADRTEPGLSGLDATGGGRGEGLTSVCVCVDGCIQANVYCWMSQRTMEGRVCVCLCVNQAEHVCGEFDPLAGSVCF